MIEIRKTEIFAKEKVVILLAGGDKRTQAKDIKTALRLAQNI